MRRRRRVVVDERGAGSGARLAVTAAGGELVGSERPPRKPTTPAASTISGNGRLTAKMATNAATATPQSQAFFSVREPMRYAADTTMAVTAGLIP